MQEVVVIVAGLLLGAGAARVDGRAARTFVVLVGAVVIGTVWSRAVGEPKAFALWDIAQALVAAVGALALAAASATRRA